MRRDDRHQADGAGAAAGEPAPLAWHGAIGLMCLALSVPLALYDTPPLLDYPSHLGRMRVLVADEGDVLRRIWTPDWSLIPNLALDLCVPLLARAMPLETAMRLFAGLALLLPPLGVVALSRVVFRRRSWWPLVAFIIAYDGTMLAGFLNFRVGVGLALLLAAAQLALRRRGFGWRLGLAAISVLPLYFCHLTALALHLAIVGAVEAEANWRERWLRLGGWLALAPLVIVPLVLLRLKPATEEAANAGLFGGVWTLLTNPLERLRNLATAFLSYDPFVDLMAVALVVVPLAVAWRRGCLARAPGLWLLALGLFAAFPLAPMALLGGTWVDRRVALFAVLVLIAATDPLAAFGPARRWLIAAGVGLGLVRVALVGAVWADFAAGDLRDLERVTAAIEPEARVLVVRARPRGHPAHIWWQPRAWQIMVDVDATIHWPALALIRRGAFLPLLHTGRGRQPLAVRASYGCLARPDGQPPHWPALMRLSPTDLEAAPYLADWPARFDYVLLLQAGEVAGGDRLLPELLAPVAASRIAAVYRVRPADGGDRLDCLGQPRAAR